jgi:DNA-binding MarR family transcriptional regulator
LLDLLSRAPLGHAAARQELEQSVPIGHTTTKDSNSDVSAPASYPFRGLPIRLTFRTVRVLSTIAAQRDASDREIDQDAGVADQGQMSKLLRRLEKAGLIENLGEGHARGANAWRLTAQGQGVLHAVGGDGQ